jgi:hypothetical protein
VCNRKIVFSGVDIFGELWHDEKAEKRGCSSVVERHLAKVNVARSNRVSRFLVKHSIKGLLKDINNFRKPFLSFISVVLIFS